ncbi:MAG: hypothetical protein PVI40_09135 [Chlamydiota bacterium]|jgi:Leucine-rich repeat (LRR) protein
MTSDIRSKNLLASANIFDNLSPQDIFSYLLPQDSACAQRTCSAWHRAGTFARIETIANSDDMETIMLTVRRRYQPQKVARLELNLLSKVKDLVLEKLFNQQAPEELPADIFPEFDPTGEVLGRYISKILSAEHLSHPEDAVAFLESFSPEARKTIQFLDFSPRPVTAETLRIFELSPNVRSLKLAHSKLSDDQLFHILGSCLELESINLVHSEVTGSGLENASPNLKKLDLYWCSNLRKGFLNRALAKFKALEYLGLAYSGVKELSYLDPSHLKHLSLGSCPLEGEAIVETLSRAEVLEDLFLYNTDITKLLLPNPERLKRLDLSGCRKVDIEDLMALLSKTTNLIDLSLSYTKVTEVPLTNPHLMERLELKGCKGLSEETCAQLLSQCTNLEVLDLSFMPIKELNIPNPGKLKVLKLQGCKNLNEEALLELLNKATNLEELNLSGTDLSFSAAEILEKIKESQNS